MVEGRRRVLRGSKTAWIVLIVALPLLALAERGFRAAYARFRSPTGDAQWIWAAPLEDESGVTFFVFRDIELSGFPGRARILCRADEEYFLYLNGALIGAGRYLDGQPLDSYEVGYLLEPGVNRLAAELRSGRGVGGFLLELEIEGKEALRLGTDRSWRVARRYDDALLTAGADIAGVEEPRVWAAPPVGRWGLPAVAPARLGFVDLIDVYKEQHAPLAMSERTAGAWRGLAPPDVSSPPLGRTVTFDFGREVAGHANVVFGRKEGARALIYFGLVPPDPAVDRPDAFLVNPDGRKSWSDTRPRRFRYMAVVATAEMVGARVLPLLPEFSGSVLRSATEQPGVFGLEPLALRPPVEHEIRGELERLAGVAEGEGV